MDWDRIRKRAENNYLTLVEQEGVTGDQEVRAVEIAMESLGDTDLLDILRDRPGLLNTPIAEIVATDPSQECDLYWLVDTIISHKLEQELEQSVEGGLAPEYGSFAEAAAAMVRRHEQEK